MDVPPPDPQKLLAYWMEWERGEVPPGRVMSNLKTAGLRTLLEQLGAQVPEPAAAPSATTTATTTTADAGSSVGTSG